MCGEGESMMVESIVEFSDWQKLDLRVAKIIKVEEIEGADKLYKITLDVGPEIGERVICAGIKEYYLIEELINKIIIYFANLTPRKMRGIESQGMLLAASTVPKCLPSKGGKDPSTPLGVLLSTNCRGKVVLISPEKDIGLGSRIS